MRRRHLMRHAALASTAVVFSAVRQPVRAASAGHGEPVDVELVLAVDVSTSISPEEMELQFQGYAAAFRTAGLAESIAGGPLGAIACTLFAWSEPDQQQVLVPWTRINGQAAAEAFASAIDKAPRTPGLYTSISGAIDFALELFDQGGFEGTRRIVDISGDGVNNSFRPGRPLARVRDDALERGIVLNGLAILDRDPAGTAGLQVARRPPLDEYYRDAVIGGPGCFLVSAEGFETFGTAVRRKLIRELAHAEPGASDVERVVVV